MPSDQPIAQMEIQLCGLCDEPTGRCEDDSLTVYDVDECETITVCQRCYNDAAAEQREREGPDGTD